MLGRRPGRPAVDGTAVAPSACTGVTLGSEPGRGRQEVPVDDGQGHHHEGDDHHGHGGDAHGHSHEAHGHGGGIGGILRGMFHPHSHGAASADRALESTAEGIRAVFVSLAGLAVTAAVELLVSLLTGSVALLADTVHNFADALTAVPLALAFRMGSRPPTRRYTYGFGRAEDLAGISIVGFMAASTAVAAYESVHRLLHPSAVHGTPWVAVAGLVGFAGNELVAVYRVRVGRRIGSAALVADGLHARTDGLTSLAVVAGAIAVGAGAPRADPIVGLVITVLVVVVLLGAIRQVYRRLMDSVDPELVDEVEGVLRAVPGIDGVQVVRIRWVGHELRAEIEVSSDSGLSLVEAHAIATEAHHRLLHEVPRLASAVIHTSPTETGSDRYHDALMGHLPEDQGR
ncbi:MAG: cation transporter [Acidobacteriota bacterium]|nr:cation transporter [Acidobacteriota bacterium]